MGQIPNNIQGAIQEIDQHFLCGKPVELTILSDFMKMISSLRTEEIKLPQRTCVCPKCHKLITVKDVANGNFEFCESQFVHRNC